MKRSFVPVSTVLGIAMAVMSHGTASAATGLTTCSVSVDHDTLYATAGSGKFSVATFTVDTSLTLVKPAEFYWLVIGEDGDGYVGSLQSTDSVTPFLLPWSALLNLSTKGLVSSLTKPFEVEFQISNYPQVNQPSTCRIRVTLMPNAKPSAPSGVTAAPGDASAHVEWLDPNGFLGASYRVTASPGDSTCTADYPDTSCTVEGLENGTPYTFIVTSESSGGTSDPSGASLPVTPVPGENGGGSRGPAHSGLADLIERKLPDTGGNLEGTFGVSVLLTFAGVITRRFARRRTN